MARSWFLHCGGAVQLDKTNCVPRSDLGSQSVAICQLRTALSTVVTFQLLQRATMRMHCMVSLTMWSRSASSAPPGISTRDFPASSYYRIDRSFQYSGLALTPQNRLSACESNIGTYAVKSWANSTNNSTAEAPYEGAEVLAIRRSTSSDLET